MQWKKVIEDCAVEPGQWLEQIQRLCLFVGDGTLVYGELIQKTVGSLAHFAPPYLNRVRASVVAHIGLKQILGGEVVDVASLVPHYIRTSDAEIMRKKNAY